MYLFPLIEVVGKCPHISEYILPYLVVLGSTVVQYTIFVLIFSSRSVSGGFSLVNYTPCILICRFPIVVFLDFSIYLFRIFSVRPGQVFRKPGLISLRRLTLVGLKSAACKYWASYGSEVFVRMLFAKFSDCCGPRGTSQIPVFLFLFPLILYSLFFWVDMSCLPNLMLHP